MIFTIIEEMHRLGFSIKTLFLVLSGLGVLYAALSTKYTYFNLLDRPRDQHQLAQEGLDGKALHRDAAVAEQSRTVEQPVDNRKPLRDGQQALTVGGGYYGSLEQNASHRGDADTQKGETPESEEAVPGQSVWQKVATVEFGLISAWMLVAVFRCLVRRTSHRLTLGLCSACVTC